ncbi:transcription factor FapR [Paenibacillus alkalitolerans]|uniref:transcription factor FapR n=1 Tax=Paenibacillus alkalitolerans TaxID=2799335 RepID=UPI0018F75222|nr:transcription factor FapR [Paenibacillus alkalitolerans]
MPKPVRQERLKERIRTNPFITDEELSLQFGVSIQTVRLDRMELGIPEVRERIKLMAAESQGVAKSLGMDEVIGEVIDLQLDKFGISILEIGKEHVFARTKIARGHHIFAQANSLAVAIIDDEVALTASADIRFIRPVRLGERCVAKAYVRSAPGDKGKAKVELFTYVGDELVFQGHFVIYRSAKHTEEKGAAENADIR